MVQIYTTIQDQIFLPVILMAMVFLISLLEHMERMGPGILKHSLEK